MTFMPAGLTLPGVTHHRIAVAGTHLHCVSAGDGGSPILLVHGFPESWWAFHKLIPLLASDHRVIAVDLRGFGDSDSAASDHDSAIAAEDLSGLVDALDLGRVHLVAQDISGATAYRFAARSPHKLLSFTGIEMGLAGFGLESFADVGKGGAWHIGVMAASGVPEMLLSGRERLFLGEHMFPSMCATPGAVAPADIAEFARGYARPDGWSGATALYRSMLNEGREVRQMAETNGLAMPVLAIGAGGGRFTLDTLSQAARRDVASVLLEGVGHYAAMEAPQAVAEALLAFTRQVDDGELR